MLDAIEKKFTGTGNNHKIFMQVVRDEKLKANWQPMTHTEDGEFMQLQELAASAIVTANRWSKSLAGFATAGQLGTNQQVRQELEYLQNTVVKQRQNVLLSRVINPYLETCAAVNPAIPAGIQFGISNSLPVSFMGEISVENALTTDEKREVLGYGPMDMEEGTQTDIKTVVDAYGVGVRAGAITSQAEDEEFFRRIINLSEMSPAVQEVWTEEGVRRPITLKSTEEREAELNE